MQLVHNTAAIFCVCCCAISLIQSLCSTHSLPTIDILTSVVFFCSNQQQERLRQKELQAQQLEEQRQQFKLKTQNLLKFKEEAVESKPSRGGSGRKKKERSGDIYSEGEGDRENQPSAKKRRRVRKRADGEGEGKKRKRRRKDEGGERTKERKKRYKNDRPGSHLFGWLNYKDIYRSLVLNRVQGSH